MKFKVEGSRRNKKFVESVLPSILSQLKLENCRKSLIIRIADECGGDSGFTLDLTDVNNSYLVVVGPQRYLKDIGITLAHELVHVKQMAKGTLKDGPNGSNYWAGKKYSKNTKYLDRPWEIEAFSKQELLLRRAIKD
jgi:hypothetical protein